jgi:hypothetical protein
VPYLPIERALVNMNSAPSSLPCVTVGPLSETSLAQQPAFTHGELLASGLPRKTNVMQVTSSSSACMAASIGFTVDFTTLVVVLLWSSPASQLASRDGHRDRFQTWSDIFRGGRQECRTNCWAWILSDIAQATKETSLG